MPELWDALNTAQQPQAVPPDMWNATSYGGTVPAQGGQPARVIIDTSPKPVPTSLWDAISNVGQGLSRDIGRGAKGLYEALSMPDEQAQAQTREAIAGALKSMWEIPQKAIGASETMRTEGTYNPAPVVDAAMLPMGTGGIKRASR